MKAKKSTNNSKSIVTAYTANVRAIKKNNLVILRKLFRVLGPRIMSIIERDISRKIF